MFQNPGTISKFKALEGLLEAGFHIEGPRIFDAAVQNLVAQDFCAIIIIIIIIIIDIYDIYIYIVLSNLIFENQFIYIFISRIIINKIF
jgi:hypothetical protein